MRYTLADLAAIPDDPAEEERIRNITDEEIERAVADDSDAQLFWTEEELKTVRLVLPPPKEMISIRLDADVLEWFRSLGKGYQTRINMVLRHFMETRKSD
ncbi:MAG: BrnA antitoxin family protein [Geminicoccaceae bacterium]|nr:BrnA antitoxin family protein [Geminicoccaceae bacterium]